MTTEEFDHSAAEKVVKEIKYLLSIGASMPLKDVRILSSYQTTATQVFGPQRDALELVANNLPLLLAYVEELKKDYVWESAQLSALKAEVDRLRKEVDAAWGAVKKHNRFLGKYRGDKEQWVADWGSDGA